MGSDTCDASRLRADPLISDPTIRLVSEAALNTAAPRQSFGTAPVDGGDLRYPKGAPARVAIHWSVQRCAVRVMRNAVAMSGSAVGVPSHSVELVEMC